MPTLKLSRVVVALCTLFIAPVCISQTASKAPRPSTPKKSPLPLPFADARQMTVLVKIKDSAESLGSAVWIGKTGYLATCYHVVKNIQRPVVVGMPLEPTYFGGVAIVDDMSILDVTVVAWNETTDVAILKAANPPGRHPTPTAYVSVRGQLPPATTSISKGATIAAEPLKPGQSVLLAGYPLNQTTLILQTGTATGEGFFPSQDPPLPPVENGRRIMLSLVSNPGNSGGPVLDNTGRVIALLEGNLLSPLRANGLPLVCSLPKINTAGSPIIDSSGNPIPGKPVWCTQNSGISLAVPAQFISDLAEANHIDLR
jgi:S1-C subfamily serine protease